MKPCLGLVTIELDSVLWKIVSFPDGFWEEAMLILFCTGVGPYL